MNVCMLAYTFYIKDNRVRRYAEALAARGDHVEVFSLHNNAQPKYEIIRGVHVYRIQERAFNEKGRLSYLYRLIRFLISSAYYCAKRHFAIHYDLIHVHSLPDVEVFSALIPKLFGAKIILDIHDIMPELYISKFNRDQESLMFHILLFMEKLSCSIADHIIVANHIWGKRLITRSVKENKCSVFLNYPDGSIFSAGIVKKRNNNTVIVYPGTLNFHQGIDYAIEAFALMHDRIPDAEFHIYGEGSEWNRLIQLTKDLHIDHKIIIRPTISLDEIPNIMAQSDIGIVPKRSDSFGNEAFSTKILEFMALGVPVLVADTKIDTYYFNDSVVKFFKSGDKYDLSEKMYELINNNFLRDKLQMNASEFVKDYMWEKHKKRYYDLVDSLVNHGNKSV